MVRLRLINILHHCRSKIYKVGVAASRGPNFIASMKKKSVESSPEGEKEEPRELTIPFEKLEEAIKQCNLCVGTC